MARPLASGFRCKPVFKGEVPTRSAPPRCGAASGFGASIRNGLSSLLRARAVLRLVPLGVPVGKRQAGGASARRLRTGEQADDRDELAIAISAPGHGENIADPVRGVFTAGAQPSWRPARLSRWRLAGSVAMSLAPRQRRDRRVVLAVTTSSSARALASLLDRSGFDVAAQAAGAPELIDLELRHLLAVHCQPDREAGADCPLTVFAEAAEPLPVAASAAAATAAKPRPCGSHPPASQPATDPSHRFGRRMSFPG
jgi:hypothetical protein